MVSIMNASKNLVIVESPAKGKTIQGYLGKDFDVRSSYGHIRDLPKKGVAIDIEHDFAPTYEVSPDKKKTVAELRKAAKGAETVWLASDEDREGEAIAWHLAQALGLDEKKTKRIVFHEITKGAIEAAVASPRAIDTHLVDAQQARRVLDRLVGYELSPLLWRKVRPGLSAGRVQSVAVRIVVDREREIMAHQASASFKTTGTLLTDKKESLVVEASKKLETKEAATAYLLSTTTSPLKITAIDKTAGTRRPSPPFTTSTLQQEASRRLGFSVRQTMVMAQRLYEAGQITYMRTDSLNLSDLAITQATATIKARYGDQYLNVTRYRTKSKGAQEAHEAIRPTDFNKEQAGDEPAARKLYRLIYERALASQMTPAKVEKTKVTIQNVDMELPLLASGEMVVFDGFLALTGRQDDTLLPTLEQGMVLSVKSLEAREVFSRPPARYAESSLVKKLEELGIGRPSTYAPTISTIQTRGYVEKGMAEGQPRDVRVLCLEKGTVSESTESENFGSDKNKLIPTAAGIQETDFLVAHFPEVVDYSFTAQVETELDEIAEGNKQWQKVIKAFYGPFHALVDKAQDVSRFEASQARLVGEDPKSGEPIFARYGRFGPMLQKGEGSDDVKPVFAPLPAGEKIETVTMEAALQAFKLPRIVGKTADGKEVSASIGRFGPYLKLGESFISIKDQDPHTITMDEAVVAIAAYQKQQAEKYIQRFKSEGIDVVNGRYGPYITDGKKNAKIPKDKDPAKLSLAEIQELLKAAPAKGKRTFRRRLAKKA
jgi:DNA topoisomerase-1